VSTDPAHPHGEPELIFILALRTHWRAAHQAGSYQVSTLGQSLDDVGYLHASRAAQLPGVAERHYRGVREALVLLVVDPLLVDVPIVVENGYPHLYGPLPVAAVTAVLPVTSAAADDEVPLLPHLPHRRVAHAPGPFIG
jgi:uncharacterized protein (DUF952 family)